MLNIKVFQKKEYGRDYALSGEVVHKVESVKAPGKNRSSAAKEENGFLCFCSCIHSIRQNCFNVKTLSNTPRAVLFSL